MKMAFYKGPGTILDKLIRFVTRSEYSHCEIVIDGLCWSSSPRDGGVRGAGINLQSGHWDVIDITADKQTVWTWFYVHQGEGYDWVGLIRTLVPFFPHGKARWFCSEACGAALGFDASRMSPQDLFDRLRPR